MERSSCRCRRLASGLAAGLLAVCGLAGAGEDSSVNAKERLPIYAWYSVEPKETSAERYRELAEAGFTHSFSGFPDAEALAKALEAAKAAGVLVIASCPELKKDPAGRSSASWITPPSAAGS